MLRLTLARSCAWTLLLSGWVGMGSLALVLAASAFGAFALVALWLLGLGVAARVATRDSLRSGLRRTALALCALLTAASLAWTTRGGGLAALLLALAAWAGLTALASGVVRSLRLAQPVRPGPPIGAASLGALVAALALGDPGDLSSLTLRLAALVLALALVLAGLHRGPVRSASPRGCRAGLFDCSLPAWPAGAWQDLRQWPTLLAGLAMLPMMAELPLIAAWCRAQAVAPQAMVLLHLGAMFAPTLLLRRAIGRWSPRVLSAACAACLALGAVAAVWLAAPLNLLGVALMQGAAWGLAWAGQLWAPERRGSQGASALRAALGYALLTLAFGAVVATFGATGITATHATLGAAALLSFVFATRVRRAPREPEPPEAANPRTPA
jgi:hypothetical protein